MLSKNKTKKHQNQQNNPNLITKKSRVLLGIFLLSEIRYFDLRLCFSLIIKLSSLPVCPLTEVFSWARLIK